MADRAVAAAAQEAHHDVVQESEHRYRSGLRSEGRPHQVGRNGSSATRSQCSSGAGTGEEFIWSSPNSGEEHVTPHATLALAGERVGGHLHDPASWL